MSSLSRECPFEQIIERIKRWLLRAKSIEFVHIYYFESDRKPYHVWMLWKPNIYMRRGGIRFSSKDDLKRFLKEVILDKEIYIKIKELKDELNIIGELQKSA